VCVFFLSGKVHGSLARAGKVRGQTPKVAKQDKKKKPRGRAHKRMQYNRRFVTAGMSLICIFQIIMYFQVYLILFYLGFAITWLYDKDSKWGLRNMWFERFYCYDFDGEPCFLGDYSGWIWQEEGTKLVGEVSNTLWEDEELFRVKIFFFG